ncbi:T9SS type B sorting domain-containing protein [Pseudotamlana carrageenivorans]|nr:T9SS type B sorting domain-containing protein [Tamlana carrageenivorans]
MRKTLCSSLFFFISILSLHAQLGFCGGNSGAPIFIEDFGTAPSSATEHMPLPPPGTTNYTFLGNPQTPFGDGKYTVTNMNYQQFNWFNTEDHTTGDTNGRMLLVNAALVKGEFFNLRVTGLCENTTYEFSSWVLNLTPRDDLHNGSYPNPCNVSFEIWDSTETTIIKSGDTGDFYGSLLGEPGKWEQYGLVFQTQAGQAEVVLKIVNNGVGGYGNDLAIDDIVFRSCGDTIAVTDGTSDQVDVCPSNLPYSTTITAVPDHAVFNTHFYQWEESSDGTTWTDILGATSEDLNVSGINTAMYYRAKVAEHPNNLNNLNCITYSDTFQISILTTTPPTGLECWETATLDPATCTWVITGTQPAQPTNLECWETATFNNTTCAWDIAGTQPTQPTNLECWETATFNNTTCAWDVTGTQPAQPTNLECWETATFNYTTCMWDIAGTQPVQPTNLECWETTTFNNTTCAWDVTGIQPAQPTNLDCWETASFNNTNCSWDVTGIQPAQPTNLECWETTTFNNTTCAWEVTGTQPTQPTNLECWETTTFNNTTCSWDVTGTQPAQPTNLECWETTTFNNTTCVWEVTGTQPAQPTNLECWETTTFNNTTCSWEVTAIQPAQPTNLECWETATFNNTTCSWDVTGIQPAQPTNLECWETASFNNTTCAWEVTGTQPTQPTNLECWETATFNYTTCSWDIESTIVTETYDAELCTNKSVILTTNNNASGTSFLWSTGETTESITVNQEGQYSVDISVSGCLSRKATFTVTKIEPPIIDKVESQKSDVVIYMSNSGNYLYSIDGGTSFKSQNIFYNMPSGVYNIVVKNYSCDTTSTFEHVHFKIPKFFTPNNDGYNDTFELKSSNEILINEVSIFDRFGKLLKHSKSNSFSWDGTFNGKLVNSDDYWYVIIVNNTTITGHFSLKR